MQNTYTTPVGDVSWKADEQSIHIQFKNQDHHIKWKDITKGGLVGFPDKPSRVDFIANIPGADEMLYLYDQLLDDYAQLVLVRGWLESRVVRLPMPEDDPAGTELLDIIQEYIGDKWLGEIPKEDYEEVMGIGMPRWYFAMVLFGFMLISYVLLQVIIALSALSAGNVYDLPGLFWLAVILLFMLIIYGGYQYLSNK